METNVAWTPDRMVVLAVVAAEEVGIVDISFKLVTGRCGAVETRWRSEAW